MSRVYWVACREQTGGPVTFNRRFRADTEKKALALGRSYARKKGIDPKGRKFSAEEENVGA